MVFSCIASAAGVELGNHDNYLLHQCTMDEGFAPCIDMLHEWAPRSYVAKGACEVLWSRGIFQHGFYSDSDIIIDPHASLFLSELSGGNWVRRSVGTPVDLRECVQKIQLYTNPSPRNLAEPKDSDAKSLLKLKQELCQLSQFPHLRQVHLDISIPQECDAHFEAMTLLESIYDACKKLQGRIGAGLKVTLAWAWPYDAGEFEFIEEYDISWMWTTPSQADRQRVRDGVATVYEKIIVLIADGINSDGQFTLLEELRFAASQLPQTKEDIMKMQEWNVESGFGIIEWLQIRTSWGRDDE